MAILMTLTLEPIKSLSTISTLWLVFFGVMVKMYQIFDHKGAIPKKLNLTIF